MLKVSSEARDLVQKLLLADPDERLTADQCLSHPWLSGDVIYIDVLNELETTWMRRCLARRRYCIWYLDTLLDIMMNMNTKSYELFVIKYAFINLFSVLGSGVKSKHNCNIT